jgi:hypothetical protein
MAIDPNEIELTPEMKRAIAAKADETGKAWTEVVWGACDAAREPEVKKQDVAEPKNFYDAVRDYIGVVKDAPPDLSTAYNHMEGFGRDPD